MNECHDIILWYVAPPGVQSFVLKTNKFCSSRLIS